MLFVCHLREPTGDRSKMNLDFREQDAENA